MIWLTKSKGKVYETENLQSQKRDLHYETRERKKKN